MVEKKTTKTVKKTVKTAPKAVKVVKPAKPAAASYLDVPVYDMTGKSAKNLTLPKAVFGVEVKPQLIAQYVRVFLVNKRQGNASTKTRGEVMGTTKKVYKQKGTGRARHGARKASLFVGGGITFGPLPRDFSLKINKKQKRLAFLGALTAKAKDNAIAVLANDFLTIEPKTKLMSGFLKTAGYDKGSVLVIFSKMEKNNLMLASRNLPNIEMTSYENLNAYEVLKYKRLLFMHDTVAKLESFAAKKS